MADTAVLLEIITYIFQRTPPTADCDEPLSYRFSVKSALVYFIFCILRRILVSFMYTLLIFH